MRKHGYEHFRILVLETHRKCFYVSTTGEAYSLDKFSDVELKLKKSLHGGLVRVAIKGLRNPILKRIIYQAVYGPITESWHVQCIDGNEMNCNIQNLRLISKRKAAQLTGALARSKAVVIKEGRKETRYRSVREAAKALHVSYQTLLDYLGGGVKNSCLKKRGRSIYYYKKEDITKCLNKGRKLKSEYQPDQSALR